MIRESLISSIISCPSPAVKVIGPAETRLHGLKCNSSGQFVNRECRLPANAVQPNADMQLGSMDSGFDATSEVFGDD